MLQLRSLVLEVVGLTGNVQHLANFLCVHHELHEYDQDEDSSKACVHLVLLSHDVFTFRKVLVAIKRMGGLSENGYLAVPSWLFCLEE